MAQGDWMKQAAAMRQQKVSAVQFVAGVPTKFGLTTSLPFQRSEHNEIQVSPEGLKISWRNVRDEKVTERAFVPWANIVYLRFEPERGE